MKYIYLFLIFLITGCAQTLYVEKQSEIASQGVYGIPSAIDNGRIDKADSISQSLKTLYSAPKNPIVSNPIIDSKTGLNDIILPSRLNGKVIVIGSNEYKELLMDKNINKELASDNKDLTNYKNSVDKQKIVNDQVQDKILKDLKTAQKEVMEYHDSLEYKIKQFFKDTLLTTLVIGIILVVLCVLFPPLTIFLGSVFGILAKIGNIFLEMIENLISYFKRG